MSFTPYTIQLQSLSELISECNCFLKFEDCVNDSNIFKPEVTNKLIAKINELIQHNQKDLDKLKYLRDMLAQAISYNLALSPFDVDFLQSSVIEVTCNSASTRDIIFWSHELYIVESSNENSAYLLDMDGEIANNIYYGFENEPHYILGKAIV